MTDNEGTISAKPCRECHQANSHKMSCSHGDSGGTIFVRLDQIEGLDLEPGVLYRVNTKRG